MAARKGVRLSRGTQKFNVSLCIFVSLRREGWLAGTLVVFEPHKVMNI